VIGAQIGARWARRARPKLILRGLAAALLLVVLRSCITHWRPPVVTGSNHEASPTNHGAQRCASHDGPQRQTVREWSHAYRFNCERVKVGAQ